METQANSSPHRFPVLPKFEASKVACACIGHRLYEGRWCSRMIAMDGSYAQTMIEKEEN
jgi:hypothetical protein